MKNIDLLAEYDADSCAYTILCSDYSDCKSSENFLGVSDEFSDYSDFMYKFIKVKLSET